MSEGPERDGGPISRQGHDLGALVELVDDLERASTDLIEYGDEYDVPAIEYNARRIRATVRILEQNVPREPLYDERDT